MTIPKHTDLCRKGDFFPLTIYWTRIELISGPSSFTRTQFLVPQPSSTFFLVGFILRQVLYSGMQNGWAGSNLTFFNIKIRKEATVFPLKSHRLQWCPIPISELISVGQGDIQANGLKIELHALFFSWSSTRSIYIRMWKRWHLRENNKSKHQETTIIIELLYHYYGCKFYSDHQWLIIFRQEFLLCMVI